MAPPRQRKPASVPVFVDPAVLEAVASGASGDPFSVLGPHGDEPRVVRTMQPDATRVWAVDPTGKRPPVELPRLHSNGLFGGSVPGLTSRNDYRLRIEVDGETREFADPYRFPPLLGELDALLIGEGKHLRLYEKLGAHPDSIDGVPGVRFAVWAPNARRVSVVGDFNAWDGRRHPMRKRIECGVWELFIPGLGVGALYKYELVGRDGAILPPKADPFAFRAEHPPSNASVVHGLINYAWTDEKWLAQRADAQSRGAPISIYECHLASWMRVSEEGDRYLSYAELAERLVPYVREMGFTHVELLPITEYPFDGSWGYQPIGLFAPTIRHGTAEEFAAFVDACHSAGLGVIVDWVPGHFPSDAHGLGRFDGTALYEHEDPRQGYHVDWNTLIYNYGRSEVVNFLLSNALYWLDRFHIDGLRVDAVASMLYLDYSRKPGEWVPNRYGGNENIEAIACLRRLNELTFSMHPGTTTIAEESTAWPSVSRPTYLGGLGFGFKWNMGWMHDTLRYMGREPVYRRFHQNDLTFGLLYAFSENFVLPLSHDEVVHGKGSLLDRMAGDRWQKFANLRAYFGYMWTHPGKKLLFMGGEFAQEREWNYARSLDWHLLDDPYHKGIQRLVRDLNAIYKEIPALYEHDCESTGFEWIDASDPEQSVISYLRKARSGDQFAVVVCNFTPVVRHGYRIGVPARGAYIERLNTDASAYCGSGVTCGPTVSADEVAWHGRPFSLGLTLPPLAALVYQPAAP